VGVFCRDRSCRFAAASDRSSVGFPEKIRNTITTHNTAARLGTPIAHFGFCRIPYANNPPPVTVQSSPSQTSQSIKKTLLRTVRYWQFSLIQTVRTLTKNHTNNTKKGYEIPWKVLSHLLENLSSAMA
jgi:hypothetical protein